MTATLIASRRSLSGERDTEGYRSFTLISLVRTDLNDGPYVVMNCPGLPAIGSQWLQGSDDDAWSFCLPDMKVTIHEEKEGDANRLWRVEQKFTNKPQKRCQDTTIDNPLMEPDRIKGGFAKKTKEYTRDKDGLWIRSSSWEQLRGPQVEFDYNTPTVTIEQNVADLELATFTSMIDHVNDSTLWGFATRCVKLSNASWERKLYGVCTYYYTRSFEFELNSKTFDRDVLDEGTKCLNGHWDRVSGAWILDPINGSDPSPKNPAHFIRYRDKRGEVARVILDGRGLPSNAIVVDTGTGTSTYASGRPATRHIKAYHETNFLVLGIPTTF